MTVIVVESARYEDLSTVNTIYNYYIEHSCATFDTEVWCLEQRERWFEQFSHPSGLYHFLVAKRAGEVLGFAYNTQFREKAAFDIASELTVYLQPKQSTQGVGSLLYKHLLQRLAETSLHRLYSFITVPNDASIALHQKFDFKEVGFMHHVGLKFDKFHSVVLYEKQLNKMM